VDIPETQLKNHVLHRRLGDDLIAEGLLALDQLEEAIEYQCIYGGKLGTSLVELGIVEEDQLAKVLSQQLRLHYIKPELLMNVPKETLQLVPREIAIKYKVVPYHKEGRRLFLAMTDATNLTFIDDLSFKLNHIIIPLAIPEIRLMLALKKHYGLQLSPRFEALSAQLNRRAKAKQKSVPAKKPAPGAKANPAEPAQIDLNAEETWPMLGDEEYDEMSDLVEPEKEDLAEKSEPISSDEAYFDFEISSYEISYTSLCQQLVAARDRNDIARALINYLSPDFFTCGLFMVRPTVITGWLASCKGAEPLGFDGFSIPQDQNSIFDVVIKNKVPFLGMVTDTPLHRDLLALFGTKPPQASLLLPLLVRDRLVSVIYLLDQMEALEKRFSELNNLIQKAEMAFTMLILKNKLLTI